MTRVLQWKDAGKKGLCRDGREVEICVKESLQGALPWDR